ncbi:RAP protein, putative [Plasmodium ovale]|uniref:RAP protein, putative n=1 Tax=Plasmodium ovale TaxID=36330 RepID=A0A1D3UAF4_PLAOA|nr:RAP protein, putative [Plasmodium ovale]
MTFLKTACREVSRKMRYYSGKKVINVCRETYYLCGEYKNDRKLFCSNNIRYRKIVVIPYDKKDQKLEYKNIPFDIEDLNKKNKKDILKIYKIIRNTNELNKLPTDFVDNLFECTKKFIRCLLPYEFIKIFKTLNIIKKKDKHLIMLLHQQIKRIYKNFDIISISKLFQIYIFTKSKPVYLIKKLTEIFLSNIKNCKPWYIREVISIFSFFKINSNEHINMIYKICLPLIAKNIMAFTPKDNTIIFYSLVKMNKYDTILTSIVAKNVILKISLYEFYQLAIVLNSFSKVGEKNNKLCKVICDKIKQKIKYHQENYTLFCYFPSGYDITKKMNKNEQVNKNVKIQNRDEQTDSVYKNSSDYKLVNSVPIKINDEVIEIGEKPNSAEGNNFVEGTKHNGENTEEHSHLLQRQTLKPKDVSIILNALIKLEYYDNETFNCLIPYIVNNVSKFSPQSLSNLVHSFSQIQIDNTLLLDKIISASIMNIQKFKNKEISNLANSLVRLNRKDKTLFTYIADEFLYRATIGSKFLNYHFDILSLQQLAYSFSKVGLKDDKVYVILYKLLVKKVNEINKRGKLVQGAFPVKGKQSTLSDITQKRSNTDVISMKKRLHLEENFDFFCLATFVNSYGKAKIQHQNFFHFVSYIIRKKKRNKDILSNHSLCSLVHGLVKLQMKDKTIYKLLLKECVQKIDSFQPYHIIILLYSFSKLKVYSYRFVKKSIQILSMNIHNLTLSDLSLSCYALSNFLYRDIIFLYKVHKIVLLNNQEFDKRNVTQLFNSFTKLCFYHNPFYDFIFQKIITFMHDFSEKELTNVIFSFIYYFHMNKLHHSVIYGEVISNERKREQTTSRNKMEVPIMASMRNAEEEKKKKSKGHIAELSDTSNTASMENIEGNIHPSILLDEGDNNSGVQVVKRNYACISECPEEYFKNELNLFFNLIYILSEKYRQKMSLISIYQLQIVDLYLRAFFPNYFSFPIYLKTFLLKCRNVKLKIDDYVILSSKTHRNISRYLNIVGVRHRSEVLFGPYQLDIVVDFVQNRRDAYSFSAWKEESMSTTDDTSIHSDNIDIAGCDRRCVIYKSNRLGSESVIQKEHKEQSNVVEKLMNKNILIEVDGISHFYKESYSRTMNSIIKDFILKKLGWHIIHIPYQEWNQCFNFKKKLLYAFQILRHIVHINRQDICIKDFVHLVKKRNVENAYLTSHSKVSINANRGIDEEHYTQNGDGKKDENHIIDKNMNETDEKVIPDYYTISEETIFLNQIKNRNKYQQRVMKKLREDAKLKYDFNISCKMDISENDKKKKKNTFNSYQKRYAPHGDFSAMEWDN